MNNPYRYEGTNKTTKRRPVPTPSPGLSDIVNNWIIEWTKERRELEFLEAENEKLKDDLLFLQNWMAKESG